MERRALALVAGIATLLLLVAYRSASLFPPDKIAVSNGTSLAYTEAGNGPTVVFVHGAWADTRAWAAERDVISAQYRFVAYSMRYHMPNKWQDDGTQYSVATHATDLAGFIKSLNVGSVHVVAHSYGGQVAAQLAVEHPELVKTLVLEEPSIYTVLDSPEGEAAAREFLKSNPQAEEALKNGDSLKATQIRMNAVLGDPDGWNKLPAPVIQMLSDNAKTTGPLMHEPAPPPMDCKKVGTIRTPTLLIEGDRSIAFFHVIDDTLARCRPGTERVVIARSDHMMQVRNPEALNEAILKFLQKHS